MVHAEKFALEQKALFERYGFKASYIEEIVPLLVEAYMNEDEKIVWGCDHDLDDTRRS